MLITTKFDKRLLHYFFIFLGSAIVLLFSSHFFMKYIIPGVDQSTYTLVMQAYSLFIFLILSIGSVAGTIISQANHWIDRRNTFLFTLAFSTILLVLIFWGLNMLMFN